METEIRRLFSPVYGEVSPLCELYAGDGRLSGEGFAVRARSLPARLYYRLAPAAEVRSPADGAVTAADDSVFRIRTGDGIELEVKLPCSAEFLLQTGDIARAGEPFCRIDCENLCRENAAVSVLFTDCSRVTELHVLAGFRRAGAPAAEFSPRNMS